jgi:hypothetical protein
LPTKVVGNLKLLQLETTPLNLTGPRGKLCSRSATTMCS